MKESGDAKLVGWTDFAHGARVVTEFIGIDVSPAPSQGPLLFETHVSGGRMDGLIQNYKTWKQAQDGHFAACWQVKESLN